MTQSFTYYTLPHVTAAAGEALAKSLPANTHAWSTTEKDVVVSDGSTWRLPGNLFSRFVYGITGITELNQFRTAVTGGEEGATTGFCVAVAYIVHRMRGNTQRQIIHNITSSSSSGGWMFYLNFDDSVYATIRTTPAPGQQDSQRIMLSGIDKNRIQVAVLRFSGLVFDAANSKLFTTPSTRQGSGYNPPPGAPNDTMAFGGCSNALTQGLPIDMSFLGMISSKGTWSDAQVHEILDTFRTTLDFPTAIAGTTVAHRYSVRETLRKQAVRAGQLAPAQLVDSATNLAVDALVRTGAPVMSALDLSTENRVTYGVSNWHHNASFYGGVSGITMGIVGDAGGFWVSALTTYRNGFGPVSFGASSSGWFLSNGSATVSGVTTPAVPALMTAFVPGSLLHLALVFTGNEVQYFVNGALVSRAVFTSTFQNYSSGGGGSMWIGQHQNGNSNGSDTVFGVAGGHYVPNEAEMRLCAQAALTSNRIQSIPGKTEHLWDLHLDVVESGDTTMPPQWSRDRIGNHNFWCHRPIRLRQLHFTSMPYLDEGLCINLASGNLPVSVVTPPTGGIKGSTSGFWVSFLFIYNYTGTTQGFGGCLSTDYKGWGHTLYASPVHTTSFSLGAGIGWTATPSVTLNPYIAGSPTTPGTPYHLTLVYDGTKATIYLNGVSGGSTNVAYVSTVNRGTMLLQNSAWAGGSNSPQLGMAGGDFIPTEAEILAASTASIAARKIQPIANKTEHLWSYVDDRAEAGNKVPSHLKDRITGELAPVNDNTMTVTRKVHRNWAYEVAPIFYGVKGFNSTSGYDSAAGFAAGDDGGFWVLLFFLPSFTASGTPINTLAGSGSSANEGWEIRTGASNVNITSGIADVSSPISYQNPIAMGSNYTNRLQVYGLTWDPGFPTARIHRQYFAKTAVGTVARTGYAPAIGTMRLGGSPYASTPAVDNTILGFAMGRGIMGVYDYQSVTDVLQHEERFVGLPGRTSVLVDVTQDAKEAGLAVPTTLKNRINGQVAFNLTGTLSLAPVYHRNFGW